MRSIFASRKGKLTLKHASEEPRYTLNGIYIDRSARFKFQKLCMVQFYMLPSPPPGNPGDKSSPSVPGVGNCLKRSCPGGGGGKLKTTSCCSCEVRHLSVGAEPREEQDCLFPGRISRICSRLVREE